MAAPDDNPPSPGDETTKPTRRIGRYIVLGEIKRGGQGVVYRAKDPAIGRELAIKELLLSHLDSQGVSEARRRFRREAQAVGKLRHPNIVTLYDFIEEPALYLIMEFVSGSLHELLGREVPLTAQEALEIVRQVAAGLDEAHANGIVHRDIKPGNILLHKDRRGGQPWVKVADFGIARIMSEITTKSGLVMGTVTYMAPEQVNGLKVDAKADQFSLGVVAYELLGRKRPFTAPTLQALMYQILHEEPASLLAANPALPPEAERVVLRALAKNPAQRFDSCGLFARALEDAIVPPEPSTRITVDPNSGAGRRFPGVVVGLLVALALALSFGRHILDREPEIRHEKAVTALPPAPVIPEPAPVVPAPSGTPETHSPPNKPASKDAGTQNPKAGNLRARISNNETPARRSPKMPVKSVEKAGRRDTETPKAPGRGTVIAVTTPPPNKAAPRPSGTPPTGDRNAAGIPGPTDRAATDGIAAASEARDSRPRVQTAAPPVVQPAADADMARFLAAKNSSDPEQLEAEAAKLNRPDLAEALRDRAREIRSASAPPAVVPSASAADIKPLRGEFGKVALKARELNDRLNAADSALKGAGGVPADLRAAWNGMIRETDLAAAALDKKDVAGYRAAVRRANEYMTIIERNLLKQ